MATAEPDEALIAAVRRALLRLAREGRTATYREVVELAQAPPPYRVHRVTLALEALIREDHAAGRPLLAAFATSKTGDRLPGQGFFDLLEVLGRGDGLDPRAAYQAELQQAKDYWRKA